MRLLSILVVLILKIHLVNAEDSITENKDFDEKEIVKQIQTAINIGVPLYNQGDHAGCVNAYMNCLQELLKNPQQKLAPMHRYLIQDTVNTVQQNLEDPMNIDNNGMAWKLRRTMDRINADINFSIRKEANLPEGFPDPTRVAWIEEKTIPLHRLARSKGKSAFMQLFRHIQKNNIPMTAPVEINFDVESMRMTDMAFMYESTKQGKIGKDANVYVVDIKPIQVLSIGIRGQQNAKDIDIAKKLIHDYAKEKNIRIGEEWRIWGYSSPMIPNDRKYFEVQVKIVHETF